MEQIREGFDVFVHDGDKAFGAVRHVGRHDITIYVENAGDFIVGLDAIHEVNDGKVVLACGKLERDLRQAIGHAHTGEDLRIP